jgi:serine/threonine protein kinase/tetratricopeptide (TPR) repeat protein
MTPEEWQHIRPILESALEVDPASRASFLDGACANSFLRGEVESLIAFHEQAGTAALNPSSLLSLNLDEKTQFRLASGKRIGTYEILEEIAVGGMGAVYRAVRADGQYKQQVALKIVRSELGTELTATRFKNERQILASLNHPNIAKILDGGTTAGDVPYFVMELIEGQRIDEYCNAHELATTERLGLFLQVCSAVQYAHQHLVIHRDIKPGNILVTAEGVPKLLDFGIAKILQSNETANQPPQTISLIRLLTPEYASPEQVKNEPITTASDVYSLGVVLYELLTGRIPYNIATYTPHEISRAVCEEEPERPSTAARRKLLPADDCEGKQTGESARNEAWEGSPEKLSKRLSGDLDNIILMALRKEPQRRYASVEQFSQDIRRHLDRLPVMARRDTFGYRTSKFIARHKAGVAGTALLVVALLSALGVTLRQAQIARAERGRAERRFNDVRALANSLIFDIHDGISQLPGSTQVRELLVKKALLYLDSLSKEATGDPSLQRELASAYDRVGSLQWSTDFANQGDVAGALQSRRKALAIRESLAAANPNDKTFQVELSDEYIGMGDTIESTGDFAGALDILRKIPPILEKVVAQNSDPKLLDRQASGYYFMGRLLNEVDDPAGALENYRRAAAIGESATAKATDSGELTLVRSHLAGDHYGIAQSMMFTNRLAEASKEQEQAVHILAELSRSNPNSIPLREFLGNSYDLLGTIWEKQGDEIKALESRTRAREIFKELTTSDPKNALARYNFAFSDESLGESLIATGDVPEALRRIQEGLAVFQSAATSGSKDRYVYSGLADCYFALGLGYSALAANARGSVASQTKLWQESRAWYQKSLGIWTEKRTRGSLDGSSERETAERVAQGIAKCDAALAKLGALIH